MKEMKNLIALVIIYLIVAHFTKWFPFGGTSTKSSPSFSQNSNMVIDNRNIAAITFDESNEIKSLINKDFKHTEINYLEPGGGLLGKDYYKLTLNATAVAYIGEMKDNKPNGKGILFSVNNYWNSRIIVIEYAGYFKDGRKNGYGILFAKPSDLSQYNEPYKDLDDLGVRFLEYEGMFKDDKFSGLGNYYTIKDTIGFDSNSGFDNGYGEKAYLQKNNDAVEKFKSLVNNSFDSNVFCSLQPYDNSLSYVGEFKDGKFNGNGKEITGNKLTYFGEFKNDKYDGNGEEYFADSGKLKYKGEFSDGVYDGKGTLYNKDGSVKYEGSWSNGDIK